MCDVGRYDRVLCGDPVHRTMFRTVVHTLSTATRMGMESGKSGVETHHPFFVVGSKVSDGWRC